MPGEAAGGGVAVPAAPGSLGGAAGSCGGAGKKFLVAMGRERVRLERRLPHLHPAGTDVPALLFRPGSLCPPGAGGAALMGTWGPCLGRSPGVTSLPVARALFRGAQGVTERAGAALLLSEAERSVPGCGQEERLPRGSANRGQRLEQAGGAWGRGPADPAVFCDHAWQRFSCPGSGGRRRERWEESGVQKRGGRAVLSARPGSFPEHARDLHSHSHALGFTVSKHNPRLIGERLQPVAGGGSNLRSVLQTLPAAPSGAELHRPCSGSVFCSAGRATLCRGSPAIPSRLCCSRSWAWPSAHLAVQRSAEVHMGAAARLLAPPLRCVGWVRRVFHGLSQVSQVQTELCQAAPPSSCPVTSAQWTQCVPAASSARITVARAGTSSFLISPLLPPCPEGIFPAG